MQITRVGIPVHNTYTPTVKEPPQICNAPIKHDVFIKRGSPSFEAYIKTPLEFKQLSSIHVTKKGNKQVFWTNKDAIFHPYTVEQMANSFWEQGKVEIDTSKLRGLSEK